MNTLQLLDNYIKNSLKSGNFSVIDTRTPILDHNILGTDSKIDTYMYTSDMSVNPYPVRNVFQNFGFDAPVNTSNEIIKTYSSAHFEPHKKSKKGDDIII